MRAIVYSRVSTDAQERDGTSLDTQERACLTHAQSHGWSVVACVRDTASGYTLDRPGMEQIRQSLRANGADVLVAYAADRLARNQIKFAVLYDEAQNAGARLEFVTESFEDSAVGKFLLSARAFAAELEREKIAERTMRGKAERARAGKLPQATGAGIYGYHYDPASGRRLLNPEQAPIVKRVFESFCAGASCHGLAETLNRDGVPAFGGGRWYPLTIRRLLLNETYTGRTVYRRTRAQISREPGTARRRRTVTMRDASEWIDVPNATPAIVSIQLYAAAQEVFRDPDRRHKVRPSVRYRLSGRLRCAACGAPMTGQAMNNGRYHYYRCLKTYRGKYDTTCNSRYIQAPMLESAIRMALAEELARPERFLAEAQRLVSGASETARLGKLDVELRDVEGQQSRLADLYLTGAIPEAILREKSTNLQRKRDALETERRTLEVAAGPLLDLEALMARLPEVLARIHTFIVSASDDDFELALRALQVAIRATRDRVEISGVAPAILANDKAGELYATIEQTSA